jgi:hypothetical protein
MSSCVVGCVITGLVQVGVISNTPLKGLVALIVGL